MSVQPYYSSDGMTPEWFLRKQELLERPGVKVLTREGVEWDPRPVWNGGMGGPPQGSIINVPD